MSFITIIFVNETLGMIIIIPMFRYVAKAGKVTCPRPHNKLMVKVNSDYIDLSPTCCFMDYISSSHARLSGKHVLYFLMFCSAVFNFSEFVINNMHPLALVLSTLIDKLIMVA